MQLHPVNNMQKTIIKKIDPVFEDNRGAIYDLIEEDIRHTGLITFVKGAKRGNHYHKKSTQYTYIVEGVIELLVKDWGAKDALLEKFIMKKGDLAIIPPLVMHTFCALEPSTILDCTTESRKQDGYEDDTVRVDPL